jgi:CBS domain-containing protein
MPLRDTRATLDPAGRRPTFADIMAAIPRICSPFCAVLETIVIIRDEDRGAVTLVVEARPAGVANRPVSDIMIRGMRPVRSDDPFDVVREKFGDPKVRRLVVIDSSNEVLGIIARADPGPQLPEGDVGECIEDASDWGPSLDGKGGIESW